MGELPGLALVAALLGLAVGSFLNVVIYRLPRMLERQWAQEEAHQAGQAPEQAPTYNLVHPPSACTHCGHPLAAWENLPVLSWLLLRGRCSACHGRISLRYPAVELATAALFVYAAWRWGPTPAAAAWAGFGATLLALALIDWDTTLLPDSLTLPLLWAGLVAAALGWSGTPLAEAFWGAVAGYLTLWSVYHAFLRLTGKQGMGFGDFKLFAALGAWLGWQALIPVILLASITGAGVGITMKLTGSLREGGYVPFGPFLALGGLAAMADGAHGFWLALGRLGG
ncbi:MAG: putative type 4 prepilin-like protein leader peptide processing enzyme [Pseudomonadota bacterium]|jgi:leader peptidase (prepilin peptidase)/N-methyltransferase